MDEDGIKGTAQTIAGKIKGAATAGQEAASDAGERLYGEGRNVAGSILGTIEERPLTSVLLAAAVGYGIACLARRR